VAPGYGGPGWLWDCGYGGPWLWRPLAMAGRHQHSGVLNAYKPCRYAHKSAVPAALGFAQKLLLQFQF